MDTQEFAQKELKKCQADLFNALNNQIELAKNKLGHATDSVALGEWTLTDATEEMEVALSRIENIDKLVGRLLLITQPQAPGFIRLETMRQIGDVCREVIEDIEQDKALIARSREGRINNINKLFSSLRAAKNIVRPTPKNECSGLVLEHLEAMDQALTLLLGAGWMNGETSQGGDITSLTVSRELRLGLLNAHAAQIETTGKALAGILARLNGESFPGLLAGVPNNKELVDLLGMVHEQLGAISKVAALMQHGHVLNARDMDGTGKQWFEDRCREIINNSVQPTGVSL